MTYPGADWIPRRPQVKKLPDQDGNEGEGFWYEHLDGTIELIEDPGGGGPRPVGFGGQFGDGSSAITTAGLTVVPIAPWDGEIVGLTLRSNANANAEVDILVNGVSIFTGSADVLTLTASDDDIRTDMTDITTTLVQGDVVKIVLLTVGLDPTYLTVLIEVEI
jgi:hypothetical protein